MEVSKEQIAKGLARFIQNDMIPHISDSGMQLLLGITAGAIDTKPQVLDSILDNEMLSALSKSGEKYDLSVLKNAATSAIDKYGKLSITIPGIKFISPHEKEIQFSSDDVRKLIDRIEGR
jgi:hypothetical protein